MDRQRIHIGPQTDYLARLRLAPADHANDARAPDAFKHLVAAKRAQLLSHDARRAVSIEQQLGMFVEILTPRGDVLVKLGKTVSDRQRIILFVVGGSQRLGFSDNNAQKPTVAQDTSLRNPLSRNLNANTLRPTTPLNSTKIRNATAWRFHRNPSPPPCNWPAIQCHIVHRFGGARHR